VATRIARYLRATFAKPSGLASMACTRAPLAPASNQEFTLPEPVATRPALLQMLKSSSARFVKSAFTNSGRSSLTLTLARKVRGNARLVTALATASLWQVTQTPRPGNLRAMSGTTWPSGPATKRTRSSGGRNARVAMHVRVEVCSAPHAAFACLFAPKARIKVPAHPYSFVAAGVAASAASGNGVIAFSPVSSDSSDSSESGAASIRSSGLIQPRMIREARIISSAS
jgi:hypothetical protein